jgi:molybdopterin synthase catalytic subunit
MSTIRIQTADFDVGAECDALTRHGTETGALATFTGLVRGDDGLVSLTLEHYHGMTEREIARHVEKAHSRWPLVDATVIHRIGRLVPGDRIVFVGTTSPHRMAAFEACEFLMDYLKTRAPFWKQEERARGAVWVDAKSSDDESAERWKR